MENPASPEYSAIAESQRRKAEQLQAFDAHSTAMDAYRQSYEHAVDNHYQSLQEQHSEYSNLGWTPRKEDFPFIDAIQPLIETSEDPQGMKERIATASMYSNIFNIPLQTAFLNLEELHKQYTGNEYAKKSGVQAVWDSIQLNFVTAEYNRLSQQLARAGGNDPHLLQAIEETERRIDQLRDHAPKVWQDEYVKQGGWHDVGQFIRSVSTTMAENAGHILKGMGAAALVSTGVGALAGAAGLSSGLSALLVAGASKAAIAGSTYDSTWGIKYREMTTAGIPHDIAINFAKQDALIEGLIEGALGGVESAGAKTIASAIVPKAVRNATSRWFISGKMGVGARAALNILQQGVEEGTEEFIQALSSGNIYNEAVEYANRQGRENLQRQIANAYSDEVRRELEKELENYTDIDKKEINAIFNEAVEGFAGGFWTGIFMGIPVSVTGGINDSRSAATLARMAQIAPNEAAFVEAYNQAKTQGFQLSALDDLKTDEQREVLSGVYRVNNERLTPEQRKAKEEAAQDAAALAEVTSYKYPMQTWIDETTNEEVSEERKLSRSRQGELSTETHETQNDNGSISGIFIVTSQERTHESDGKIYANEDARIVYTVNNDKQTVTVNSFTLENGFINPDLIRQDIWAEFTGQFDKGTVINWNLEHDQYKAIRQQLITNNPRGEKHGLNYSLTTTDAQRLAQAVTPLMPTGTSRLSNALAGEIVNTFIRRPGESLQGTIKRLNIEFTNDPSRNPKITAAQTNNKKVQGATFRDLADRTKRIIYLSKKSSDPSTLIHEFAHIAESELSDAERRIAAKALNGYKISKGNFEGQIVDFTNISQWQDIHKEAFTDALENYLTNGTLPEDHSIKPLFEKIKEFMKRIYETLTGWTEITPELEKFMQSFVSGELREQAETGNQTHEDSHSETHTENTVNDTREAVATAQRDAIINDPNLPLEAKTDAVLDAAGEVLLQAGEITQEEQRNRINHVLKSNPLIVDTIAIPFNGDIRQLKRDAFQYGKNHKGSYINKSDKKTIDFTIRNKHGGLIEIISHDHFDRNHLQSIAAIPQIATEAQYITSKINEDPQKHPGISEYRYYLSKLSIDQGEGKGSQEFIVKSIVSIANDGKRYYDHRLTEIEKVRAFISSPYNATQAGLETNTLYIRDNRLREILQEIFTEKVLYQTEDHKMMEIKKLEGMLEEAKNAHFSAPNFINSNIIQLTEAVKSDSVLFQFGDTDMIEEAADFENGKEYRAYIEEKQGYPSSFHEDFMNYTEEQIDAWYESIVQNSKKAVNSIRYYAEPDSRIENPTAADTDSEFLETIHSEGELENFIETSAMIRNAVNYTQEDDSLDGQRDLIKSQLKDQDWQAAMNTVDQNGKLRKPLTNRQRNKMLTLIDRAPRDYRAIYAELMERPDLAVSPEDSTAEKLKHRMNPDDIRREGVENLTPEKRRQLANEIAYEAYAKKVDAGTALIDDPQHKEYFKRLNAKVTIAETALKDFEADRNDDNIHLEKQIIAEIEKSFEHVLKQKEFINQISDKLDKAIKTGERDAAQAALRKQSATAYYDKLVKDLEALARTHQLELNVNEILASEKIKEAARAAKEGTKEIYQAKLDALKEEYKDYRKSAKTEATLLQRLARKAARAELLNHINDMKQQREKAKEITKAKRGVVKRIFRKIPLDMNADQGMATAIIQYFAEPSFRKGINEFINEVIEHDLPVIFRLWKVDQALQWELLKDKAPITQDKMRRLFSKERLEDLTTDEKRYLARKIAPEDWIKELGLDAIAKRRSERYPMTEEQKQLVQQYLPIDVYNRIMDKPFSQWTLAEAEQLAKIIDDLTVQGKSLYRAHQAVEKKRIAAYQQLVVDTLKTTKLGLNDDEIKKELERYKTKGIKGTSQEEHSDRKLRKLTKFDFMNIYRFTRILDNNQTGGYNQQALYRAADDSYKQKIRYVDSRTEKVQKLMKDLGITESELWQKKVKIDLDDLGVNEFTTAELLGVLCAVKNEHSKEALMYGNLLDQDEKAQFQKPEKEIDQLRLDAYRLIAADRLEKVITAAEKLLEENPNYKKILNAIDQDFVEGGKRLNQALVRYNNTFMHIVDNYFPIVRTEPVNANATNDVKELMGKSSGQFNLYVEKGMTKKRVEIPMQYQTAINLDIMRVWTEAVEKEEHFMAYAQTVKDLNQIYINNRQVRHTIRNRYGKSALDYIDKYIHELASPAQREAASTMDKIVKQFRGKTAASYLGWKTSSIALQAITSPAPFFGYMNPFEYWGAYIDFASHWQERWNEICDLSPHMKHRSANMMVDLIKEQAKHAQGDNLIEKALVRIDKFNERGIKGLEFIDRLSVAPGWLVLFRKEHKRLTNDPANASLSEKEIRVKAAQHADDIVRLTQPSSRTDDLSPLFKVNSELAKAFLQFQQSLNVIFQNIRYDMPQMIREKQGWRVAGTVMGYACAGLLLGVIMTGFDEDDDEKDKAAKMAWWATTQFTDSFPLIGNWATGYLEELLTGKKQYRRGFVLLPQVDKLQQALETTTRAITQGEYEKLLKAAIQAAEAGFMSVGLPTSGTKEFGRFIGVGDGDGEFDLHPGTLIGRDKDAVWF